MSITACPRCGSKKIFQGRLKEGVLTGYTSKEVCRDCGYRGSPIIFDSEKEYKIFVEELKNRSDPTKKEEPNDEIIDEKDFDLSDKEKEIVKFLKETEEEINELSDLEEKKSKLTKNTVTALGFTLIIAGILLTSATSGNYMFFTGIIMIPMGIILFIIGIMGPTELELKSEEKRKKYSSFPKIAGSLLIIIGITSLLLYSLIFFIPIDPSDFSQEETRITVEEIRTLYITVAIIEIIFCIFAIIGGISAITKKSWGIAILGSILGSFILVFYFVTTIVSLACLILIAYSRYTFKNQKIN